MKETLYDALKLIGSMNNPLKVKFGNHQYWKGFQSRSDLTTTVDHPFVCPSVSKTQIHQLFVSTDVINHHQLLMTIIKTG